MKNVSHINTKKANRCAPLPKSDTAPVLFDNQHVELLTYQECAARLKVTVSSLQHLVHRRSVPFLKMGRHQVRFLWDDVVESLKKGGSYGSKDI